jgi:hypothetical protein
LHWTVFIVIQAVLATGRKAAESKLQVSLMDAGRIANLPNERSDNGEQESVGTSSSWCVPLQRGVSFLLVNGPVQYERMGSLSITHIKKTVKKGIYEAYIEILHYF